MLLGRRLASRTLAFESFGVDVQVVLSEDDLRDAVGSILPPGWRESDGSASGGRFSLRRSPRNGDGYSVTVDDQPYLEYATLDVALELLDAQMRLYIAANAREWIFVHAGVVAIRGQAIALPGESFSGKSTLVHALVQTGATYYSDEYAVFDRDGKVHPYPRRLSLRTGGSGTTVESHVHELGGEVADRDAELAAVVITRYRANAEWCPERPTRGKGLLALLTNTVPARERPRESLVVLHQAMAGAIVLEGDRGEAALTARSLLADLAAP